MPLCVVQNVAAPCVSIGYYAPATNYEALGAVMTGSSRALLYEGIHSSNRVVVRGGHGL
jgi:hypothetical protein